MQIPHLWPASDFVDFFAARVLYSCHVMCKCKHPVHLNSTGISYTDLIIRTDSFHLSTGFPNANHLLHFSSHFV